MRKILIFLIIFIPSLVFGDVVKPALIEINVYKKGDFEVEIRTSIEAILAEIGAKVRDTTESPNAKKYDILRELPPADLSSAFNSFQPLFLKKISLQFDGNEKKLSLKSINIPEAGYAKVPRISTIILTGNIPKKASQLTFYYPLSFGTYAVRVKQIDLKKEQYYWSKWQWIRQDKESSPFQLTEIINTPSSISIFFDFMKSGFLHIIPNGLDHILFILSLFLFSNKLKTLIWQISMFTIAHTLTLSLSIFGLINPPPSIIEPLIALSIAFVALENIFKNKLEYNRLFVVFLFGLLHGFGFANMLLEFNLQKDEFIKSLIGFNIGVEIGQLAILLLSWLTLGLWFNKKSWYRKVIIIPLSLIISLIAVYWFMERLDIQLLTSYL